MSKKAKSDRVTPPVLGFKNQRSSNKFLGTQTDLQLHIASGRVNLEEELKEQEKINGNSK